MKGHWNKNLQPFQANCRPKADNSNSKRRLAASYPRRWTWRRRRPSGSTAAAAAGWWGRAGRCWFCSTTARTRCHFRQCWPTGRSWSGCLQVECLGTDKWLRSKETIGKKEAGRFKKNNISPRQFFSNAQRWGRRGDLPRSEPFVPNSESDMLTLWA